MILASERRRRVYYPGRRPAAPQAPGATPDPVDAQQQVKHAAKNRREPGETDPRHSRAAIALVEKHMRGNAGCQSDMYQQDDGVAYHAHQTRHAEAKTSIPVSAGSVRRSLLSSGNVLGRTARVRLRAARHHIQNEMTARFAAVGAAVRSHFASRSRIIGSSRCRAAPRIADLDRACRERYADMLLVTGPVERALRRTYEAAPTPSSWWPWRQRLYLRQSRTRLERRSRRCGDAGLGAEPDAIFQGILAALARSVVASRAD